ncbi:MAG: tetratricopeptide repeat protein [Clostridiales bacterium]|nr:tetratricopeptide repeat protein [Clostridiales bacterium]
MENQYENEGHVCKNCGSYEVQDGYDLNLCRDCRKILAKRPIPRKILLFLLPVLLVVVISLFKFPASIESALQLKRAEIAESNKEYVTAMKYYEKLSDEYPEDIRIKYKLMNAYYYNNYPTDIYNTYEGLIGKEDTELMVSTITALLDKTNKYYSFSDELYSKLESLEDISDENLLKVIRPFVDKNPNEIYGAYYVYDIYMDMGKYNEAKSIINRVMEKHPDFYYGYILQSNVYTELGDYEKALESAKTLFSVNSESVDSYASMAKVELKRKNNEKGLELAKKAYELDSRNSEGCLTLALAYHYNNMLSERDELYSRCKELGYVDEHSLEFYDSIFSGSKSWQE